MGSENDFPAPEARRSRYQTTKEKEKRKKNSVDYYLGSFLSLLLSFIYILKYTCFVLSYFVDKL